MNENTLKIIEELAKKLGTTSEYLWGVLVKQAPINSTIDVFLVLIIMLFGFVLYKIHKKLMLKNENGKTGYYEHEEMVCIPRILAVILFFTLFVTSFFLIKDIIIGYFNPEYWALDKILSKFK